MNEKDEWKGYLRKKKSIYKENRMKSLEWKMQLQIKKRKKEEKQKKNKAKTNKNSLERKIMAE